MPYVRMVIAMAALWPAMAAAQSSTTRPATSAPARPQRALLTLESIAPLIQAPKAIAVPPVPERAAELLAAAEKQLAQGKVFHGMQLLERAAGFAPAHPQVRRALGDAQRRLGNIGMARQHYRKALAGNPADVGVLVGLAELDVRAGDRDAAMLHLRTALISPIASPQDPRSATALMSLAMLLANEGYDTAALECYDKLLTWLADHGTHYRSSTTLSALVRSPARLHVSRGGILSRLKQHTKAAEAFGSAYQRDHSNIAAGRLMVESLISAGRYPQAADAIAEFIREPDQSPQVPALIARLIPAAEDPAIVKRLYGRMDLTRQRQRHLPMALALAEGACRIDAWDQAAAISLAVLGHDPANVRGGQLLGRALGGQADPEKARVLLVDHVAAGGGSVVGRATAEIVTAGVEKELDRIWSRKAMADRSDKKAAMHFVAGHLAAAMGRRLLAADQFRRAVNADKQFLPGYEALVNIYLLERDYDKAERALARINAVAGENAAYHKASGRVALAKGEYANARIHLTKALEAQRSSKNQQDIETILLLADAHLAVDDEQKASEVLAAAINLQPDNVDLYRRLFHLLLRSSSPWRRRQAAEVAQRLSRRRPSSAAARLMLIEYGLRTAGTGGASRRNYLLQLAQLRREEPDNIEVALVSVAQEVDVGRLPLSRDRYEKLSADLTGILRRQPGNVQARQLLARLLRRQGKNEEALAVWHSLYREQPDNAEAARQYIQTALQLQQTQQALAALRETVSRFPRKYWPKSGLLALLVELKRYDEAAVLAGNFYRQANSQSEKSQFRFFLIKVYREADEHTKAHTVIDRWLAESPEAALLDLLYGSKIELYCGQKQFDQAVTTSQKWLARSDSPDDVRSVLIRYLIRYEAYARAGALIDEWTAEGSLEDADNFIRLRLIILGELKQWDQLEAAGTAWVAAQPWGVSRRRLVIQLFQMGSEHDRAVKLVEQWLADLPRLALKAPQGVGPQQRREILRWHHQAVVSALDMAGRPEEGIKRGLAYVKLDPGSPDLHQALSRCLEEAHRDQEAIAALEKSLALLPQSPLYNNNLGYMLAARGLQLPRAEMLIRRALALDTEQLGHDAYLDSLAWVLYKQQKFPQAREAIEASLKLVAESGQTHPIIHDHAGDIYYRLGKAPAALEQWTKSLAAAQEQTKEGRPLRRETREILRDLPGKIKAAQAGLPVKTSPVGPADSETKPLPPTTDSPRE